MKTAVYWIEIVSYLLIIWIGLRLVVTKGWAFVRTMRGGKSGAIEEPALATVLAIVDVIVTLLLAGILTKAATGNFEPVALLALLSPDYRALLPALVLLAVWLVGIGFLWRLWGEIRELTHALRPPRTVGAAATPAHLQAHHDHARPDHAHHDHAHHAHAHHAHAHHDHAQHDQHDHAHDQGHHHHAHVHDHNHHGHDHAHDHAHCDHDHGSAWSHAHAPEPSELAGPGGWKRGLTAIFAVGLRPCSGAILVLVFTLAQGLFWAGVVATFVMGLGTAIMVATIAVLSVLATNWAERFASTRGGYGMLFMRGIEVAAALLITAFGALLLMGYMASERMFAV
jgi:nickel/cobalt exporter